ncbi:protein of unknown function [Nitrosospira multiformis]|uniref:DUF4020 domain-containing protein n=1 Tax=Nitrosospira multiformis TaxID=1231 RepID=A0A1H8G6K6_9PROT|nr:DUF4020 domain-containing protein [Nitrosospira multiformis]SEN39385.1 protein of unknown function [Nitrosospira multiformis]
MPQLGPLQIPYNLIDAIRDDRLVIFAGAGVSVGPPANLPDFLNLAGEIARSSALSRIEHEPVDHFLGRLQHQGVRVHQEVANLLSDPASEPTALHLDLIRIFRSPENVRLVTTNFDLHFATAAQTVFGRPPDIYSAPALPLGRDFRGLVHVHGVLKRPKEIVLTDADFGRAYLTEGWARRFLLDVFRTYTVLFVGYSHSDVVMKYLARALPVKGPGERYALTEEDGNWRLYGISPILFQKATQENTYQELYDGIQCLADRAARGVLDWQTRLTEIGSQLPPEDARTISEIEEGLREVHTTRFLLNSARKSEWPAWLNTRNQLSKLFDNASLNDRDKLLVEWLANNYVIDHAHEVIRLIVNNKMRLNPECWWAFGRALALDEQKELSANTLSQWVSILLACTPAYPHPHLLEWLATRCGKQGCIPLAMEVFLFMASCRLSIKAGYKHEGEEESPRFELNTPLKGEHFNLNEVWENQLKPNLELIAQPLLSGIVRKLEEIHYIRQAWNTGRYDWGDHTWDRSAIEPHEQDRYPDPMDVLIDAGRDTLEWLASHKPILLESWMEQLIVSEVPLLRRLAIHASIVHPNKSADEKLTWLLTQVGLYLLAEHHEVYRAAAQAYPKASKGMRETLINAVIQHEVSDAAGVIIVERTARERFNWLDWLKQADPACPLIEEALAPIRAEYPHWIPRDYPDLEHRVCSGEWAMESPWTVEQILAQPPSEQLEDLLSFKGSFFDGPNREGLLLVIQEACKRCSPWAFALDVALSVRTQWDSDLWASLITGLTEAQLEPDEWKVLLKSVAREELQSRYAREVADLLCALMRDQDQPVMPVVLEEAQIVASDLWRILPREDEEDVETDWLIRAINHPGGILIKFWIGALSQRLRGETCEELSLPDSDLELFTSVVEDGSVVGGMGRAVLASQAGFLFRVDEKWTREHVIPLFTSGDLSKFKQAWDGFLTWGNLYGSFAEALKPAFLAAATKLNTEAIGNRRRFVELFAVLAAFHIDNPASDLLPVLLHHGSADDRNSFAYRLGVLLRHASALTRQSLWDRWIYGYWKNRLTSTSVPPTETEMATMLNWLPHLDELFPAGVNLAVSAPLTRLEHCNLVHELRKSDLLTRFPADIAKLLIYLCPLLPAYHQADVLAIVDRLSALETSLKRELDESLARAGFI